MSQFWWNACEDKNKMHWVSWEKICKAKKEGGLGFRDIGRFNQALLAKQAWRLLDSPSTLIARVYKAKYYAAKTFLEAKVGYRSSYAWESILFGRELLERGLMKVIGNGQDTSIWVDKWIIDDYPRRPINRELFMDLNLRVSSLITPQGDWDLPRLQHLFPPDDVTQICSFPPSINLKDRFVWAYTKDGKYAVKSGNWILNREATSMEVIPPNVHAANKVKEKAWELDTAPKIKLFFWRALSRALAVAECLRSHGLQTNPIWQLCRRGEETISHVLFACTLAAQVWSISDLPPPTQGFLGSVIDNIQYTLSLMKNESIPQQLRAAIPWILWEIWKARNSSLYAGKQNDGNILLATTMEDAGEWVQHHTKVTQEQRMEIRSGFGPAQRWIKPSLGVLKCNVHASWVTSTGFCGGAWILRDHRGDVLFHARDAFTPMYNRIAAELKCIRWALQSLHEMRFQSCEVWSDCSAAILALQKPQEWPKYRSQVNKIIQVIQVMREVKFMLSSPKANSLAREITCSVTRGRLRSYIALGGPTWLQDRIERDRLRGG